MPLQQIVASQANAEVPVNENFQTLEYLTVYAKRPQVTAGLTWGYYGGYWQGYTVADGTLSLTASSTNYVVVNRSTGAISTSTNSTNWNNTIGYAKVYIVITGISTVSSVQDYRLDKNGIYVSFTQSVAELGDVDLTGLSDKHSLVYDQVSTDWKVKYVPNASSLPSVNFGTYLYNTVSSEWQNRVVPNASALPSINHSLPVYNSISQEWQNKAVPNVSTLPIVKYSALVYNTTSEEWEPRLLPKITVSTTAPSLPDLNDIWIST